MGRKLVVALFVASCQSSLARDDEFLASKVDVVVDKTALNAATEPTDLYVTHPTGVHSYTYHMEPKEPKSFGENVKTAGCWFLFGIVSVCTAFPILWFNEKREVHMEKIFGYARKVIKTDLKTDQVNKDMEARVVHVVGETSTKDTLTDDVFHAVSVTNCAFLDRSVQMYQWVEKKTENSDNNTVTYSYEKQWTMVAMDSSGFHESGYTNPKMPFEDKRHAAGHVNFGAFVLPDGLVVQMTNSTPIPGSPPTIAASGRNFKLQKDCYTTEVGEPKIGDLRVKFTKVPCGPASVVAVQAGHSFVPLSYDLLPDTCCSFSVPQKVELPSNLNAPLLGKSKGPSTPCGCVGECIEAGESLFMLTQKKANAEQMIEEAEGSQKSLRMLLMVVGYLAFLIGFYCMFNFVPTLFQIIPLVGTWIQAFGSYLAMAAAFFLSCFCCCGTVGFAWVGNRPLYGILLLSFAAAMVAGPTYFSEHPEKLD